MSEAKFRGREGRKGRMEGGKEGGKGGKDGGKEGEKDKVGDARHEQVIRKQ